MVMTARDGDQMDATDDDSAAAPILVTGFGAFPGVPDNPSERFARSVHGQIVAGRAIVGRVLPVEWRRAWPALLEAVDTHRPIALLMYGVARHRTQVEVERVARNRTAARVDAVGELPPAEHVLPDAPDALLTTLPWRALTGPHVGTSDNAGDYLCNYVMFRSVHALCNHVPHCGFVHMPEHETPGAHAVLTRLSRLLR